MVAGIADAAEIGAEDNHTCARLNDGTVRCWGYNRNGELGNGTTTNSAIPLPVSNLNGVVALAEGGTHNCALLGDGTVRCWGFNADGQLGDGTRISRTTPVTVPGLSGVVELEAGSYNTCALLNDGAARCWGANHYGQLGNGTTTGSDTPVAVSELSGAVEISIRGEHACARLNDGTMRCWGNDAFGQLGNGCCGNISLTPIAVSGLNTVVEIGVGFSHSCARLSDNTMRCWGQNTYGQLGNGTTQSASAPVEVGSILDEFVEFAAGESHNCARRTDNKLSCWGWNDYGQLGNGTSQIHTWPQFVQGISDAAEITAGGNHTCTRLNDNSIRCWGDGYWGQLGNASFGYYTTPVNVSGFGDQIFGHGFESLPSATAPN